MKPFSAGHDFIVMPFSAYHWLLENLSEKDWQTFCTIYGQMHINRARRVSVKKSISLETLAGIGVINVLDGNKVELNPNWDIPEVLEMRNKRVEVKTTQDERNKIMWYLVKVFCQHSNIKKPSPSTSGEWAAFNKLWRKPLLNIFDQAPGDTIGAKGIATEAAIKDALDYFNAQGLTYKAPSSIESVVYSRFSKEKEHGYY